MPWLQTLLRLHQGKLPKVEPNVYACRFPPCIGIRANATQKKERANRADSNIKLEQMIKRLIIFLTSIPFSVMSVFSFKSAGAKTSTRRALTRVKTMPRGSFIGMNGILTIIKVDTTIQTTGEAKCSPPVRVRNKKTQTNTNKISVILPVAQPNNKHNRKVKRLPIRDCRAKIITGRLTCFRSSYFSI